jgi:hypothetical protein
MNKLILLIIKFIHILFVIFVVFVPFTNIKPFLMLHAIFVPFLLLHWGFNDDTCSLTVMEETLTKKIYGKDKYKEEECITCRVIKPVYKFINNKSEFSGLIWLITLLLALYSIFKIYYLIYYKKIKHPLEFFIV